MWYETLWRIPSLLIFSFFTVSMFVWCRRLPVLCRQRSQKWKELILYLALRLGIKFVEWTPCNFRILHLVAIVLSLSSISNSLLPIPCVAMSSVKCFYTPGFFPLINRRNFLSRRLRLVLQRTFLFHNFSQSALGFTRKVIGRFEHRIWSDWRTYFMDDVLKASAIIKPFWFLNDASRCGSFTPLFRKGHETWCTL